MKRVVVIAILTAAGALTGALAGIWLPPRVPSRQLLERTDHLLVAGLALGGMIGFAIAELFLRRRALASVAQGQEGANLNALERDTRGPESLAAPARHWSAWIARIVDGVGWLIVGGGAIPFMGIVEHGRPLRAGFVDDVYSVAIVLSKLAPGAAFGLAVGAFIGKHRLRALAAGILLWLFWSRFLSPALVQLVWYLLA